MEAHTNDPIGVFEQVSALLLPPQVDAGVDFYPSGYLLQSAFDAADFWGAYISQRGGCVAVERGQSHVVKVYESYLGNTTLLFVRQRECRVHWTCPDLRSDEHDSCPAAYSSTPDDDDGAIANFRHALVSEESIITRELLSHQLFIIT